MTWAKFEDRFPWHRKVRGLSDTAFRLHVSGICWSCEHLTDGLIPTDDLPLVSDVRRPEKAVEELSRRGLWDEVEGGWCIHDFLEFNESRDVVQARRAADAERKRRGREGRSPSGVRPDVQAESPRESVRTEPARPEPNRTNSRSTSVTPSERRSASTFEAWWSAYPRRVGKQAARAAYERALRRTGADALLAAAVEFRDDPTRDPAFTPHPATWLNQGRWDDEGPARPQSVAPNSADERTARNLALVARFAQQEQQAPRQLTSGLDLGGMFGDVS